MKTSHALLPSLLLVVACGGSPSDPCADVSCGEGLVCVQGVCQPPSTAGGGSASTIGGGSGAGGGSSTAGGGSGMSSCGPGLVDCAGSCKDAMKDRAHCGACNRACAASEDCTRGACTPVVVDCRQAPCPKRFYCDLASGACKPGCAADDGCPQPGRCELGTRTCACAPNTHVCGEACAPDDDATRCGPSCRTCPGTANGRAACRQGQCTLACNPGFNLCNGVCVPETTQACGASCSTCTAPANGAPVCRAGACEVTCNPGFHKCGTQCVSDTSPQSCGSSCTPCPSANGTASCTAGTCGLTCNAGFVKCAGADCRPKAQVFGAPLYQLASTDGGYAASRGLGVADLDKDGRPDITTLEGREGGRVLTFFNRSTGWLASSSNGPYKGSAFTLVDFDGDGNLDMVAANNASCVGQSCAYFNMSSLKGSASGYFAAAVSLNGTSISGAESVVSVDLTKDGKPEVVAAAGALTIAYGLGTSFTSGLTVSSAGSATDVAVGDVDADGNLDLVVANQYRSDSIGSVAVLLGTGTLQLKAAVKLPYTSLNDGRRVVLAKLDGDAHLDLVVSTSTAVYALRGNGDGTFAAPVTVAANQGWPIGTNAIDLNRDGALDVVFASHIYADGGNRPGLKVAYGRGDGTFEPSFESSAPVGHSMAFADMDKNGSLDAVVMSSTAVTVLPNTCR